MPRLNRDYIPEIQDGWFKNHRARLETCMSSDGSTGVTVIDWAEPGTCVRSVRYILCGATLIVCGDLGSAVFSLTERAALEQLAEYDIAYLYGKLKCCDCDTNGIDFDSSLAASSIDGFFKTLAEEDGDSDKCEKLRELCTALKSEARCCEGKSQWTHILAQYTEGLGGYNADWQEALPCCGDAYSIQLVAFMIGLRMAKEQLCGESQVLD